VDAVVIADAPRNTGLAQLAKVKKRDVQRILINIVVILIIGGAVQLHTGYFFEGANLWSLFTQIAVVAMIACAETLVMVAGCIDVSIGGVVALSGVVAAMLLVDGVPLWLSCVIAVAAGAATGVANSVLILLLGIPSLIASIGTLYVSQGIANLLSNGLPVSAVPASFSSLGTAMLFSAKIPVQAFYTVGVLLLFMAIQRYTSLNRYAIATGSNRRGAFTSGVPVRRTIAICFVLCGAVAGWGGVAYGARIGTPVPVVDPDILFQVIVACVVGGTSLMGGRGSVLGAFTGAMLIATINDSLDLMGISTFWQYIALGILLVVAVGVDTTIRGFHRDAQGHRRFALPDIMARG
jgi:ribose transport system permease protein